MAIRNWATGEGDWFLTGSWVTVPPDPNNYPQPGDQAFIAGGLSWISGPGSQLVDGVTLTLGAIQSNSSAELGLQAVTFGPAMIIENTPTYAYSAIDVTAASVNEGLILAEAGTMTLDAGPGFTNTGTIIVDGATFDVPDGVFVNSGTILVRDGGTLEIGTNAVLEGAGTIIVANGGNAVFDSAVNYTQTVIYASPATVTIADPGEFSGLIEGFTTGDVLDFPAGAAYWISYAVTASGGHLYVGAAGSDGKTSSIRLDGVPAGYQLGGKPNPAGGVQVEPVPVTRFLGGTLDFYQASAWSTGAAPAAGDYVQISAGTVTISAADVSAHGVLASLQMVIGADSGTPTLIATDDTIGRDTAITSAGTFGSIELDGTSTLYGAITARGVGATLDITVGPASGAGGAVLLLGTEAVIDASSETGLGVHGGTLVNDGTLQSGGLMTLDTDIAGDGTIQLLSAGRIVLGGAVGAGQHIEMLSAGESLAIGDLHDFFGHFTTISPSDTIDLVGQAVSSAEYDADTGHLVLHDGGSIVGTLDMPGSLHGSFSLQDDGSGGTDLVFHQSPDPDLGTIVPAALPVPAVGRAGDTILLSTLLIQAFGSIPANYADYKVSFEGAAGLDANNLSYWDPSNPSVTHWVVNGTTIAANATVDVSDINAATLVLGNNIAPQAHLIVPIEFGSGSQVLESLDYTITTVDPSVAQPGYATEAPSADGIKAAAQASVTTWGTPYNNNDCPNISNVIGAAAGAVHPVPDASTDPDSNVEGGFWRIVYRGTQSNPVSDWYQLVEPGDFVRIGWNNGGQHTTSIMGTVQSDGSLAVYDNDLPIDPGLGISGIGFHDAEYWPGSDPATITIYRLTADQRYLIIAPTPAAGAVAGEFIQGSAYNNLIVPTDLADTIALGPQNDEVQGTFQQIDNDTIQNWLPADLIDITNVAPGDVGTPQYDPSTGMLILSAGMATLDLQMPTGLVGRFFTDSDGSGGTVISEMPCFAAGTRLRTPDGEVPVETLAVGDHVLTQSGRAVPVRWIGSRQVDCTRHPNPDRVMPVRIAANAFGPGLPRRALLLSPDHAVFVEGVLIPIRCLVNGSTICQRDTSRVTYFHVELERHDILLAEGLPAESYLDTGNRAAFEGGVVTQLHPDFAPDAGFLAWEALACAPLRVTGPELACARAVLEQRATLPTLIAQAG